MGQPQNAGRACPVCHHSGSRCTCLNKAQVDEAMEAARGLPAHLVANEANRVQRGCNFGGCGKRDVFERLVKDRVEISSLLATLREMPRPPRPMKRQERLRLQAEGRAKARAERLEEAEGWTVESALDALRPLSQERTMLRARLAELDAETDRLDRIIETLELLARKERREGP